MTSRTCSMYGFDDSLSADDRDLYLLFLQYPEIDFDTHPNSDDEITHNTTVCSPILHDETSPKGSDTSTLIAQIDSSPALPTSQRTLESTPESTNSKKCRTWSLLQGLMQQSELPPECLHYYTSLAEGFVSIGVDQFETARPGKPPDNVKTASSLLKNVEYSCEQAKVQVQRVAELRALVAFNVKPGPGQLWSTYQQRAKLVTQKLALPSRREYDILEALVEHFDVWVYHDFLQMYSVGAVDAKLAEIVNDMYDKLMTWRHSYKLWCRCMQDLKLNYMQPLIPEFKKSKEAQDEYAEFQLRISKARASLARSAEEMTAMTDDMVQKLNLSARRPGQDSSLRRNKTRYKREHTL